MGLPPPRLARFTVALPALPRPPFALQAAPTTTSWAGWPPIRRSPWRAPVPGTRVATASGASCAGAGGRACAAAV